MKETIKSVKGSFDGRVMELVQTTDGQWQTVIDLDLDDGCYATIIWAETLSGKTGVWHGILYVADGFSHLRITEERFSFWLLPERQILSNLKPERFQIVLKKECEYHGS